MSDPDPSDGSKCSRVRSVACEMALHRQTRSLQLSLDLTRAREGSVCLKVFLKSAGAPAAVAVAASAPKRAHVMVVFWGNQRCHFSLSARKCDLRARGPLSQRALCARRHHPNIIRYLDSLIENDELVIVFEWAAARVHTAVSIKRVSFVTLERASKVSRVRVSPVSSDYFGQGSTSVSGKRPRETERACFQSVLERDRSHKV